MSTTLYTHSDICLDSRLETMILWIVHPYTRSRIRVRLLLDTGSNNTFVLNKTALKQAMTLLGSQNMVIQSFGKQPDYHKRDIYEAKLAASPHSLPRENFIKIQLIAVDHISGPIAVYNLSDYEQDYINKHHIILSDTEAANAGTITVDILIGQDFYYELVKGPSHKLSTGLTLLSTINGSVLAGRITSSNPSKNNKPNMTTVNYVSPFRTLSRDEEVDDLKKFISLENLGIGPIEEEISPVLDRFNATTKHNGERYTTFLPKRPKRIEKLPSNFF